MASTDKIEAFLAEPRNVIVAGIRRDGRPQLLVDDPTSFRAVLVPATAEIREDLAAELPRFRAIREKHGMTILDDDAHLRALTAEGRVLLAITPPGPPSSWTNWGLD